MAAINHPIKPTIYYIHNLEKAEDQLASTEGPAHEKIGAFYGKIRSEQRKLDPQEDMNNYWHRLGVDPNDAGAIESMSDLIVKLDDKQLKIAPTENTGVYFIKKLASPTKKKTTPDPIAVFKIGRKRAAMELLVRRLAHLLGLEKQMVPGMFCALLHPEFSKHDETVEELWNSHDKLYMKPKKIKSKEDDMDQFDPLKGFGFEEMEMTTTAVVGIVQPFLGDTNEQASLYDFTLMTMLALAIGGRDLKSDGYKGSTLYDVEDCMPVRVDPIWTKEKMEKTPSTFDLPYLDKDPRTEKLLSSEDVGKLAEIVQKWEIATIVQRLSILKIRYEDKNAERTKPGKNSTDEGGCSFKARKAEPHLINGQLNHLTEENKKLRKMLNPEQINALNTRLHRIHDFILGCAIKKESFSPQNLVFAVDQYGKIFHNLIRRSPSLPDRGHDQLKRSGGINSLTGRLTPEGMRMEISEEEISSLSSTSSTPIPTFISSLVATLEENARNMHSSSEED